MIDVVVITNSNGEVKGVSVRGHANTAPKGQDIVCSAVSVLTQIPLMYLEDDPKTVNHYMYSLSDGNFSIRINNMNTCPQKVIISLEIIAKGLKELNKKYPDIINISYFNEDLY